MATYHIYNSVGVAIVTPGLKKYFECMMMRWRIWTNPNDIVDCVLDDNLRNLTSRLVQNKVEMVLEMQVVV